MYALDKILNVFDFVMDLQQMAFAVVFLFVV